MSTSETELSRIFQEGITMNESGILNLLMIPVADMVVQDLPLFATGYGHLG